MQINVSQLLREPIGATREHQVNEAADIAGDGKDCLVQGECRLLRTQRSILAKCTLSTEVELICSRCLLPFRCPLTINFEEEYLPTVDVVSGTPLPSPEEGAFAIDKHHIIDLTEAICQYTLLAIPMKPLCHKECAGLCPNCGHNLNQGRCNCPEQSIDPRWSKLTKLL
jgi:uncharacterized protein